MPAASRPVVRLDDLSGTVARCWQFHDPLHVGRAETRGDVLSELLRAEARAAAGEWVVVTVAYEAAAAFDPALRTHERPPTGTPYVWWASFAEREAAAPLEPSPNRVSDHERRVGRMPFVDAVSAIRDRIEDGDVYQVNMTERFVGTLCGDAFDAFDVYAGLLAVQRCSHGAFVDMGTAVVASASPELFFRVDRVDGGRVITCRPMKGTAARHPRPEMDRAVGRALTQSPKDRAENVMIVDLLRNDVSRVAVAGTVRVPNLFQPERYETLWQLTSTVQATIPTTSTLTDLLSALFPCGSVTGAPKIAATVILAELEAEPRGVYCGAIALLAPSGSTTEIECSVPIRTAVIDPGARTLVYGAGGGITWSSDAAAEDREVETKALILGRSHRGFELFETLHIGPDGVRNLARHLDRLGQSADWFGFGFDRRAIESVVQRLAPSDSPQRLRIVLDTAGGVQLIRSEHVLTPVPVRLALDTAVMRSDDPFCCHKTTCREHYDRARQRHPQVDDVILVNESGHAVETTVANLAYRLGQEWFVPPLCDGGLAGIGREVALEQGRVGERSIPAVDLVRCDELAVLSDLRGWRPALLLTTHPDSASRPEIPGGPTHRDVEGRRSPTVR